MKKSRVYIFGAGYEYRKLCSYMQKRKEEIYVAGVITTKREQIQGSTQWTVSVDEIDDFDYIIVSVIDWEEIVSFLNQNGIKNEKIILGAMFYNKNFVFSEYIKNKKNKPDIDVPVYYKYAKARKKEYLKEAVLHYPPQSITIGVSSVCPNKCLFCAYHGESAKENSSVYNIPFRLAYEDFCKIVDYAYEGGVERVHVCGTGEPFANPDILRMLDYVIEKYGETSIQTEFWPQLFKQKDYLNEIVKRADNISFISTDLCAATGEQHEKIKLGQRYEELISALQYISKNSEIKLNIFFVLTKSNWKDLKLIIDEFEKKEIHNYILNIGNLYSYDYSVYTSSENVYTSLDKDITAELENLRKYALQKGVLVNIPQPADYTEQPCSLLWDKFQLWPVEGCDEKRYGENMISIACAAVVKGTINSLGYLFDYSNIMDAWNSSGIVKIREELLQGKYPSVHCKKCISYHLEDGYYKQKVIKGR